MFTDRIDRAAFAGGVAAFEQHHQPLATVLQPARHRHQLFLQRVQLLLVILALEFLHRTGFAGIENALFYGDNTRMLYGDGAEMAGALVSELKALDGGH